MLTRRGYKSPQATFPVLLMFGSIDWQFHIMFHMEHHNGNRNWVGVTICEVNCRTPRGVPGLATGTGIKKDYSSFFQAVNRVFDLSTTGDQAASSLKQKGWPKLAVLITSRPVYICCTTLGWGKLPPSIGNSVPVTANGVTHTILPHMACRCSSCWTFSRWQGQFWPCSGSMLSPIFPYLVFLYQAAGKDWTEDIEYWWTGPAADG